MKLVQAVIAGVAERARSTDISAWHKAQEMLQLREYLRSVREPHSTRDLARRTGVSHTRVTAQLTIASELTESMLARYDISTEQVNLLSHATLFRIAKLPHYLRRKPLRDAVHSVTSPMDVEESYVPRGVHEGRRAAAYARMREEGQFQVEITKPVTELTAKEASDYLDDLLPALANLAEVLIGARRSHYIALTGNGGILVYLAPVQ